MKHIAEQHHAYCMEEDHHTLLSTSPRLHCCAVMLTNVQCLHKQDSRNFQNVVLVGIWQVKSTKSIKTSVRITQDTTGSRVPRLNVVINTASFDSLAKLSLACMGSVCTLNPIVESGIQPCISCHFHYNYSVYVCILACMCVCSQCVFSACVFSKLLDPSYMRHLYHIKWWL